MRDIPLMKVDKYWCILTKQAIMVFPRYLTTHISHKRYCLLGFLKQNLLPDILEYVYKQLALPSIEYCCSIWDPYQK